MIETIEIKTEFMILICRFFRWNKNIWIKIYDWINNITCGLILDRMEYRIMNEGKNEKSK